MKVVDNNAMWA